jgi:hypothetical protein
MSRTTIRGILLGIIALTIPCYLCGIGVWAFVPGRNQTPSTNTPINTPIDPFDLPTRAATATVTAGIPTFQPTNTIGFVPIIPTTQVFPTFTLFPTHTPLPTNTTVPTAIPAATAIPLPTEPIIVPPSDTPTSP